MQTLHDGLQQLPPKSPVWDHVTELARFGLGGALGGGEAMLEAIDEGVDWKRALIQALVGGLFMEKAPGITARLGPYIRPLATGAVQLAPSLGVQTLVKTPEVQRTLPQDWPLTQPVPVPRKDGGAVLSALQRQRRAVVVASRH